MFIYLLKVAALGTLPSKPVNVTCRIRAIEDDRGLWSWVVSLVTRVTSADRNDLPLLIHPEMTLCSRKDK